jgi:hypothetical protein
LFQDVLYQAEHGHLNDTKGIEPLIEPVNGTTRCADPAGQAGRNLLPARLFGEFDKEIRISFLG